MKMFCQYLHLLLPLFFFSFSSLITRDPEERDRFVPLIEAFAIDLFTGGPSVPSGGERTSTEDEPYLNRNVTNCSYNI